MSLSRRSLLLIIMVLASLFNGCQKDEEEYTLSVTVQPTGAGTVNLSPAGSIYKEGTVVSLTVTPLNGYIFSRWGGMDSALVSSDKITMTKNMDLICRLKKPNSIRLKSSDYQLNGVKVNFLAISKTTNYLNFSYSQVMSFTYGQAEWYLLGSTCPFETSYKEINITPGLAYFFLSSTDVTIVGSFYLQEGQTTFWLNYDYTTGRSKNSITQP